MSCPSETSSSLATGERYRCGLGVERPRHTGTGAGVGREIRSLHHRTLEPKVVLLSSSRLREAECRSRTSSRDGWTRWLRSSSPSRSERSSCTRRWTSGSTSARSRDWDERSMRQSPSARRRRRSSWPFGDGVRLLQRPRALRRWTRDGLGRVRLDGPAHDVEVALGQRLERVAPDARAARPSARASRAVSPPRSQGRAGPARWHDSLGAGIGGPPDLGR